MASRRQELATVDDPWRLSAFTSALLELLLSLLLLLSAAIAFITSQLVKNFGLDPPCAYIGCTHPLLSQSSKRCKSSSRFQHHAKVNHMREPIFPDCRGSWRYRKLQPQSEDSLSINDDTDESKISEKSDSNSRHSTADTFDLELRQGHFDECRRSHNNQNVIRACSASSWPIYKKPLLQRYVKSRASVLYGDGKQSTKEERVPLFPTRTAPACSSNFDVDKDSSPSSDDFERPSFQKEKSKREILTDNDISMSRDTKHQHHYTLLEDEERTQRKCVNRNAAFLGSDGRQFSREELVPLHSPRSGSANGSISDVEDDCRMSFTSTDDLKKSRSQKEKLQRGTLVHTDASTSRKAAHEHHYVLLDDEECRRQKYVRAHAAFFASDSMQSANEECVQFFRRFSSARGSASDTENDCEMSSTSRDDCRKPSLQKEMLEAVDGNASISSDIEHEHQYMLLKDEDEELCQAPVFESKEGRKFEDESHRLLLEGEDEEIAKAPFFINLQGGSAQPLLKFTPESGLEAPKNSTFDLGNRVAKVVLASSQLTADIEQAAESCAQGEWIEDSTKIFGTSSCNFSPGSGESQNAGPLLATTDSTVEEERFVIQEEVQVDTSFSADEANTESIQGIENKSPGSFDGIMVEDQTGNDGISKAELQRKPPEGLLDVHTLVKEDITAAEGPLSLMELPFMVPKDNLKLHKVQDMRTLEGGSQSILEKQQLQGQEHEEKFKFVPVKPFSEGIDACDSEISLHGEDASNGYVVSYLQDLCENVHPNRGVEEKCSILDSCVQEIQGKSDGETMLKGSLEAGIEEAVDQCLISFKGHDLGECANFLDNIDVHVGGVELVKGNILEAFEKRCFHGASEREEQSSKFEQGEPVLTDSCKCSQENNVIRISCTEEVKRNKSMDIREAKGRLQNHKLSSEKMILQQSQVMNAAEDEDIFLEEDQEEGLDVLKEALRIERMALAALEAELENERNAAAIATSEAMAMISRLQEEKSAMQMEVMQLQRVSEEKAEYDEQAMELLKEILLKREKEKHALEKEVELYRERHLAEKADVLKKSSAERSNKDVSMPGLAPVFLLRGIDEDGIDEGRDALSPEGKIERLKALPSLEAFYDAGITSSPHTASMGQNMACREQLGLSPLPVEPKDTEGSRVSQVGTCFQENKGNIADPIVSELHDNHQEQRGASRSIFSTNDEETQFILERLWVLEEELRELRREDGLGVSSEAPHGHESPMEGKYNCSFADSGGARCFNGELGEQKDTDGELGEQKDEDGAGTLLQIHDVYEVQPIPNHSGQGAQPSDTPEYSEKMLKDLESFPRDISQAYMAASSDAYKGHSISQARIWSPSKEAHCDSALVLNQDYPSADATHGQGFRETEGRLVTTDAIQQLKLRLQVLETDRELLREILESFRHRDAELKLLQEIARHLRALQMVGPGRAVPGFGQSCASVLKKRRYCNGPGQTQTLLLQQKSI